MSDYDVQRALAVIKRHGAIRLLMELARDEKLTHLTNQELQHLIDHIAFLKRRRAKVYMSGLSVTKSYCDLPNEELLQVIGVIQEDPYGTEYRRRPGAHYRFLLAEAQFRKLDLRKRDSEGSKK